MLEFFTTRGGVGTLSNMQAELVLDERHDVSANSFAELRIWRVPKPVRGSSHVYKYGLAFVVAEQCVLRFDNEAGKGDHKHIGAAEVPYLFVSPERLLADFWAEVDEWRRT